MTIQRFDNYSDKHVLEEVSDGDYVLYSDHEDVVAELVEEIKDMRKVYQNLCDQINSIYMEIP
jgi:bisphosphoglycerate-dependent phosphoglycerate mutase